MSSSQKSAEYVRYSDEQIRTARNTDIVEFLERYEGFTFKKTGSFMKCKEHDSLMIYPDRRGWYWNSKNIGGSNVIDYLEKIKCMKFSEALSIIVNENPAEIGSILNKTPAKVNAVNEHSKSVSDTERIFSLPKASAGRFNRAFAYLNKTRFIQNEIISELMHEKKIYQDERGNVVFVGFNENNEPCYGAIRGTLTDKKYRGEVFGSDKRYGFFMRGSEENKSTVYVFESPIDAMSHATIANLVSGDNNSWKKHSRLSLGGVSDNALEHFLSLNLYVKNIVFCLDNDEVGKSNTQKYIEKYTPKGYNVRTRPSKFKDYNEDLVKWAVLQRKRFENMNKTSMTLK